MWSFFSVVAICLTVMWLEHRYAKREQQKRLLNDTATEEIPSAPETKVFTPDPMPPALLQLALMESEGWARESALKSMYEMYEHTKDWNIVAAQWRPFDPNTLIS